MKKFEVQKTIDTEWNELYHWVRSTTWDLCTLCSIMFDSNLRLEWIKFEWNIVKWIITCEKCIQELDNLKSIIKQYS